MSTVNSDSGSGSFSGGDMKEHKGVLGKLVLDVNAGLLELIKVYSRGTPLTDAEVEKENTVNRNKDELEKHLETVLKLKIQGLEKLIKSCQTTVNTANLVFSESKSKSSEHEQQIVLIQAEVKSILDVSLKDEVTNSDVEN